jgi:opacity protein-like surface antigen
MTALRHLTASLVLAACLLPAGAAFAQASDRTGKWDVFFSALYADSQSVSSDNGSSAHIDSDLGWGFGFGYNFNEHFGLEFSANWFEAGYDANVTPDAGNPNQPRSVSGTLESSTFGLNATYNILPRAFTPYITGGVGGTYIDTNIPDGPAVPVCWWDPWWGYYCAPAYPTKADTYFSYNAGAGLRWDAGQSMFLRAQVSQQWIDVGGGVGTHDSTQVRIDIGARF